MVQAVLPYLPKSESDINTIDIVKYCKYLGFNLSDDMKADIENRQSKRLYITGNIISISSFALMLLSFYCLNRIEAVCIVLGCGVILVNLFFRKRKTLFNRCFLGFSCH